MQREIVLDTETTGLDPIKGGHRITEIGCIELINHIPTGNNYHTYIDPEREVDPGAAAITGQTWELLKGNPLFKDIAKDFLEFISDSTLVIHNAPFDIGFLNFELRFADFPPLKNQVIDTLPLARAKFPGSPASLNALCKRFGISLEKRTKHGALIDCELLAEVYLLLIGGPQTQISLSNNSVVNTHNDTQKEIKPSRNFTVTAEELEKHEKFLTQIKDPIWRMRNEN